VAPVLREAGNAELERALTPLGRRFRLVCGREQVGRSWGARRQRALSAAARERPVALAQEGRRTWWWFEERCYWEDDGLDGRDVLALVREREGRRRRRLERAHAALAREPGEPRRPVIPRSVRLEVFRRDGGRCTECGSGFELQYDHVIPLSLGGGGTAENLQLLCGDCNRRKGAALA
jgi:hypothetical protein